MKKVVDYYQGLYELAAAVNSSEYPERVLSTIVERVATTMDAKGCSLMLLSPDRKHLFHTVAWGLSDNYVHKGPVSADASIAQALEGKVIAVPFAPEDERVQYREQARDEGIISILSVPMTLREEIIGVLRIYTQERRDFNLDDDFFVAAAANLGAIALENARLHEAVMKDFAELRREMLEWRAALGHEWVMQNTMVAAGDE
jgi:signal transduction protein with GAF and PtsI domain